MYAPVLDFPLKRRRILFEINVHAPIDLAADPPAMVASGEGWIVNVSSGAARPSRTSVHGPQGSTIAIYGASKAALNRLTNAMAVELEGTGMRVNTIEPCAAVMSEGAEALVGDIVRRSDRVDGAMVEAIAPVRLPARADRPVCVSLDLIDESGRRGVASTAGAQRHLSAIGPSLVARPHGRAGQIAMMTFPRASPCGRGGSPPRCRTAGRCVSTPGRPDPTR